MLPLPLQFIVAMVVYATNERMARRIEYLLEAVRVLREVYTETTGRKRIPFTDAQRLRLAVKGKALTPDERKGCCQMVRPSTILAWCRQLAAKKYNSSTQRKKPGRPRKPDEIRELFIRLARENLGWGYTKIRDALRGLKVEIGRSTVASILKEAGFEPVHERTRKRTWKQFIRSHWETLYACDFFAVETLGMFGTVRHMVFFVIELRTRAVQIAGMRINPDGAWMMQIARNLVEPEDGFLRNATHLIHDRDPLFTAPSALPRFRSGRRPTRKAPACWTFPLRLTQAWVELLKASGGYLLREFLPHCLGERFHQGLGGQLIAPAKPSATDNSATATEAIRCRSHLGGLLNYYHREAA
jgi:putative transposase